jgi:hypothetical protein
MSLMPLVEEDDLRPTSSLRAEQNIRLESQFAQSCLAPLFLLFQPLWTGILRSAVKKQIPIGDFWRRRSRLGRASSREIAMAKNRKEHEP